MARLVGPQKWSECLNIKSFIKPARINDWNPKNISYFGTVNNHKVSLKTILSDIK